MNSEIEQRISALWQQLGLSVEDGSTAYLLLTAFAGALGQINDEYDEIFDGLFVPSEKCLAMLLDLMGEYGAADIETYFQSTPAPLTKSSFEEAAQIFSYIIENKTFTFSYSGALSLEIINTAGAFIKQYLPVYMAISADGGGLTFDEFEALGLSWYQTDKAALPFSVIDSLKN